MKNSNAPSRRVFLQRMAANGTLLGTAPFISPGLLQAKDQPIDKVAQQTHERLPLNIWLSSALPQEIAEEIRTISPEITLHQTSSAEEKRKLLPEMHVWYGSIEENELQQAKKLQWIHSPSAGIEDYLYPTMLERKEVQLSNGKGCYAPAISEHTLGMLFALTRGIKQQSINMPAHEWDKTDEHIEMRNMTMGIVGFGGIGREIARRAKAMDMKVVAADIRPLYNETAGNIADELHEMASGGFERVLKQSDVVVCTVPHTSVSEGMFDKKAFSQMPKGVYFINVSRGKLVKTDNLMEMLDEGHIAGAALDVVEPEPLPAGHPLWNYENVVITSHIAGVSQYSKLRTQQVFASNVQRYVQGLPLVNLVDKEAGF